MPPALASRQLFIISFTAHPPLPLITTTHLHSWWSGESIHNSTCNIFSFKRLQKETEIKHHSIYLCINQHKHYSPLSQSDHTLPLLLQCLPFSTSSLGLLSAQYQVRCPTNNEYTCVHCIDIGLVSWATHICCTDCTCENTYGLRDSIRPHPL